MARKRLSALAIEKLEEKIDDAINTVAESAVFGICDMDKNVIKRLKMTATGVEDVTHTVVDADHLIPAKLEKLLYPKPWKVVYGGRGSAKTRTVSTILTESARFQTERIGCFREIQQSIEDSSYQELVDEIERKGEASEYRCVDGKITHKRTKSKFRFRGLYRNVTGVKGFAGMTKAWVEEAENVSQSSWDILEPTIRAKGSEIWVTFNPNKETDATWTQWVKPWHERMVDGIYEDDEILIIECNWTDNPWFTEELMRSKEKMKRVDFDRYMWIWEGKFNKRSDEQVFGGKWRTETFEPQPDWNGPYYGLDWGFSTDSLAATEVYIEELPGNRRNAYIYREGGKVGLEITDTSEALQTWFPDTKRKRWIADSARPEMISHMRNKEGYDMHPCTKWPGSVEDGVAWLRGCESIIIHDQCPKMKDEAMNYSYKVDKLTGNVLTDIVDKHNHFWDSVRYALGDVIQVRGGGWLRRRR